jgi:DNA-binding MarR family transcriptional regulator
MSGKESESNLSYAERAFIALSEIMSNSKKDMLENINRANKGEHFVLHFLSMSNSAVLPSELSVALGSSTARISALLRNLEKKGLLEREIDKSNRRNILVTITEAGRKHAENEKVEMQERMTRLFNEMGEADTLEFIRLMKLFSELTQKYLPFQQDKDCFESG